MTMPDTTLVAQFLAVALFVACFYHSWNTEGRRSAQQWFFIGYIFFLLLLSLLVVIGQVSFYPAFLTLGAAPSVWVMIYPALFYLAYTLAKFLADEHDLRGMSYLMFLLAPALLLPVDATGVQMGWWTYPSDSLAFLNGVPFYVPFAWGVIGAAFMYMFGRIRKIRFRGSGQLFALMLAAPLLDGLSIALIALVQVLVDALAAFLGVGVLYGLLIVLFVVLPLALAFRLSRAPGNHK
jgi:hypothetical protein